MTNEEKIIEIDEFLQRCEDWMHGEDSKTVTRCRKLLFQLNDELSKLHQPTVISRRELLLAFHDSLIGDVMPINKFHSHRNVDSFLARNSL